MSAARLGQARLVVRLREMRLRMAHVRLAEARRESAAAEWERSEAQRREAAAERFVADRRGLLAQRADQAEVLLVLLACAREDHGVTVERHREAEAALAARREAEAGQRQAVVREDARRKALAARVDGLRRGVARMAEEAEAREVEEAWRAG